MTKRMVGIALILLGAVLAAGFIGVDSIGAGNMEGIGPAQRFAIGAAVGIILVGITLIPLGNRPA
jgi:hypothetical protein